MGLHVWLASPKTGTGFLCVAPFLAGVKCPSQPPFRGEGTGPTILSLPSLPPSENQHCDHFPSLLRPVNETGILEPIFFKDVSAHDEQCSSQVTWAPCCVQPDKGVHVTLRTPHLSLPA